GAPLKRPRARGGDVPLRDTGVLMASLTGQGKGHVKEVTAHALVWGTNIEYAAIHNWGGIIHVPPRSRERPWVFVAGDGRTVFTRTIGAHDVVIPQRQFVGIGAETAQDIESLFGEFVERKLG